MGNILILISCSGKKRTENEEFKTQNFINSISENKEKFLEKRKEIKKLIQTYKVEDRELREGNRGVIGENIELIDGPDFGGNIKEKRYLPAYKRYKGRFFIQLDEEDWKKAKEKGYHILIISGLYGLISFEDSIQDYNCHLTDVITGDTGDQGTLVDYWVNTLTEGLKEYIKNNNIDMIIDLISEESYQHSIKWEEIEEEKELRILHRVFEKEAGPGSSFFLTNLGRFFKYDIIYKSPEEVRKIKVSSPGDLHFIERDYFKGNDRIIFESQLYELGFNYVARESDRNIESRLSSTFGLGNYWGSLSEFEKYYIIDGERVYLDFKNGKLKTGIPCIHSFWTATESVRNRFLEKLFEPFYDWGYREVIIPDPKSSVKSVKLEKVGRKLKFYPGVGAFETELLLSYCENPEKIPLNLRDKLKPTVEFVRKLIRDHSIFSLFRKDGVIYTQRELRNKLKGGLTNPEEIKEKVEKFHDLFFDKEKSILIAYLRLIEELKKREDRMKTSGFSENTRMAKRAYEIMINDIDEGERIFKNLIFQYGDDGMFYYQRGLAYKHWYEKTKNGVYREKAIYDFSQAYKFFPSPIWKEKVKKEIESLEPKLKIDEIIDAVKQERARIENKKNRQPYFVFGLIELYEEKVGDEDFIYFVFENYHERIQMDMREERESYDFKFGDRFLEGQLEFEEDKLKVIIPAGKNSLDSKEIEKLKEIADREGIYYISDFRKNIEKLAEFLIEKRYENNRYLDYFFNIKKTPVFSGFSGIIDELIEKNLNESQIEAIRRACFQDITFIWGPPGTGKTEVLCNILNIFYRNGYRTLVLSLSNSAVDELLKKFISKFQYEKEEIVRLGDERPQTPSEIRGFFSKKIPPYAKIIAGNFNNIFYRKKVKPFDFILIDEVSMTPIPNIVAISYLVEKGLILAGDPAQLPPPYPKEMERPNEWFSKNVFEKIGIGAENIEETLEDRRCVFLDTQYRMAKEINELVSELFYEGKLKCGKKDEVLNLNKRVFFIDSYGKIEIGPEIINRRNEPHAKAIVNYIEKLLEKLDKPLKIGIITPYNAQVCTIYKYLKEKQLLEIIKAGTVHIFQGKEYDIIFFDIPDIDIEPSPLITDKKLLNVALSRAREALIIIADKNYLLSPYFFDEEIREIYRKIIEKGEKISGDVKWIDVM